LTNGTDDQEFIVDIAKKLLAATEMDGKNVRLLGISLSNFGELEPRQRREEESDQLTLF